MRSASHPPTDTRKDQRGIALIAAILMLLLTSVLAGTFIASTSSERAISGNVHVARSSLVAADAGVRVAQQLMANIGKAKLDSCNTYWYTHGRAGNVVATPTSIFQSGPYTVTSTNPAFTATGTIAYADTEFQGTTQTYEYTYTVTATGSAGSFGGRSVQSKGILLLSASRGSFTNYLMFTNVQTTPSGGDIWFSSGTNFDGRVHTNGQFRFAFQPTFQDLVTSVSTTAWYNNNGNSVQLNASYNGNIDKPQFYGGFQRGQPSVPLPTDPYNQQGAAMSTSQYNMSTAPTNTQLNAFIRGVTSGAALPTGVYVPNDGASSTTGGIYVQGTLDSLTMFVSGQTQIYRFKQGTTLTTVTTNPSTGTVVTTKVGSNPASTNTYTTVPNGCLFVNGSISALCGPPRVSGAAPPAVSTNTQLLITTTNDIILGRDFMYEDYAHGQNVVGLYSEGGNVRVGSNAPNDCNLDAYVMATGTSGAFTVDSYNSGNPRGTFHLRGGMVSQYYGAFGQFDAQNGSLTHGYNRDFRFDRRGLEPPFFPRTNSYTTNTPVARTLAWKEM